MLLLASLLLMTAGVALPASWGPGVTAASWHTPARQAPAPRGLGGAYAFVAHQPGRLDVPVSYPRCRPVRLAVNDTLAPAGAAGILAQAVQEVGSATGLRLVLDGRTTARPDAAGSGIGVARAPALVAWTTPRQVPGLAGRVVGLGGSTPRTDRAGHRFYLTGTVALDAPELTRMLRRPGGRARVLAVVMHELGHLVGLAHVRDPRQLMDAHSSRLRFGAGDLRGLARLGAGRCRP
jgi:hypothetical protein